MLELFVRDGKRLLSMIGKAAKGRDVSRLRSAAHELKGACQAVGAAHLAELCRSVEKVGPKELDSDLVRKRLRAIDESFVAALADLDHERQKLARSKKSRST